MAREGLCLHQGVGLLLLLQNSRGGVELLNNKISIIAYFIFPSFLKLLWFVFTSFFSPPEGSLIADVRTAVRVVRVTDTG